MNIRHSLCTAVRASVMELKNVILASTKTRTKSDPVTLEDSRRYLEAQLKQTGALNVNLKHINSILSHYDKLAHSVTALAKNSILCANELELIDKRTTISLVHEDSKQNFSLEEMALLKESVLHFMQHLLKHNQEGEAAGDLYLKLSKETRMDGGL